MKIEERTFPTGMGFYMTRWVLFDEDGKVLELAFDRDELIDLQEDYEGHDG